MRSLRIAAGEKPPSPGTAKNQPINKIVFKKDIRQRDMCTVRKPHEG